MLIVDEGCPNVSLTMDQDTPYTETLHLRIALVVKSDGSLSLLFAAMAWSIGISIDASAQTLESANSRIGANSRDVFRDVGEGENLLQTSSQSLRSHSRHHCRTNFRVSSDRPLGQFPSRTIAELSPATAQTSTSSNFSAFSDP